MAAPERDESERQGATSRPLEITCSSRIQVVSARRRSFVLGGDRRAGEEGTLKVLYSVRQHLGERMRLTVKPRTRYPDWECGKRADSFGISFAVFAEGTGPSRRVAAFQKGAFYMAIKRAPHRPVASRTRHPWAREPARPTGTMSSFLEPIKRLWGLLRDEDVSTYRARSSPLIGKE